MIDLPTTYTIYPTRLAALVANAEVAAAQGCNLATTTEWYNRINHPNFPADPRAALQDGGPVTQAEMEADGWFPADDVE